MKKLFLCIVLLPLSAWAQSKLSNLPPASVQTGTEIIPEYQAGNCLAAGTCGVTPAQIASYANSIAQYSGDCAGASGVLLCTKTNGVIFASSATTDTTNATNIGSGQLQSLARLPSIGNGTVLGNTSGLTVAPTALTTLPAGPLLNAMALGTSQGNSNKWPAQLFEISLGTTGTPNAAAGPVMKISKTETYATSAACNNNQVDSQCNAALVVVSQGLGANIEQTTAIVGAAYSSSTVGSSNADIGGVFTGEATAGVTTGQGVYIQGRRDVSTANAQSGEIRVQNNSSTDCVVSYTGIGSCDGLWFTAQSDGTNPTATSSAMHVGKTGSNINGYHEGVTLNNNAVVDVGFDDQSSSTTAFQAGSGHTTAFSSPSFSVSGAGAIATTSTLTVQNGVASGAFFLGADVSATTRTANVRKLGKIVVPTYDNTSAPVAMISGDNDGTLNKVLIGGSIGSSAVTAATEIDLIAASALNTTGGTLIAKITTTGLQLPVTTVSALPSCGSTQKGYLNAVSDATSPTYNAALTGGGTVSIPVYCNGTAWTAH